MPDHNTMQAAERDARRERKWKHAGLVLDRAETQANAQDVVLTDIRVKLPFEEYGSTMVILKGYRGDEKLVGFHRADEAQAALAGALNKFHQGDVKWREDEYAN